MKPTVTFRPVTPPGASVTAMLGDGYAEPSAEGGGGWEIVPRPKWKAFTTWVGYGPYRMSIPIVLDGYRENRSVEPELERLRRMMRVPASTTGHPPVIRIRGPVPMTQLRWVIDNITHGPEIRRRDGRRVRAFLTVELLEYVPADVLVAARPSPAQDATDAAENNPETQTSQRTYTVKKGDTLWAIAVHHLGNGNRWQEIANMNGIRDPRRLQIGAVLRLP